MHNGCCGVNNMNGGGDFLFRLVHNLTLFLKVFKKERVSQIRIIFFSKKIK